MHYRRINIIPCLLTVVLMIFLAHFTELAAQTIVYPTDGNHREVVPLDKYAKYYIDTTATMSREEVAEQVARFKSFEAPLNQQVSLAATWLYFDLENPSDSLQKLTLGFRDQTIYQLDFYLYDSEGKQLSHQQSGWAYSPQKRDYSPILFFNFQVKAKQRVRVYVRLYSHTFMALAPYITHQTYFYDSVAMSKSGGFGIFYGAALLIVLYNFLFFIAIRRLSFLYFAIYSLLYLLICGSFDGYLAIYFYPLVYYTQGFQDLFLMLLGNIFLFLFFDSYFKLRKHLPWFKYWFLGLCILSIGLAVSFLLWITFAFTVAVIISLISFALAFGAGVYLQFSKRQPANILVISAFLPFLLGLLVTATTVLSSSLVYTYLFHVTYLLHILLLSVALAIRMRQVFRHYLNRERIQSALIEQQNAELARLVAIRTEALASQEANLRAVIENNDHLIYSFDPSLHLITINQQASDYWLKRYGAGAKVGEKPPQAFLQAFQALLERGLAGEKFTIIDTQTQPEHIFEHAFTPIQDDKQRVVGVTLYSQDITKYKSTEAALRYNQSLLQSIMDGSNNAVLLLDAQQSKVLFANKRAEDLFIIKQENWAKQNPKDLLLGQPRVAFPLKAGFYDLEFKVQLGAHFLGRLKVDSFKVEAKSFWVWRIGDITHQHRSKEIILEQALRLRSILDNNHDAIWLLDKQYRLLEYNQTFADGFERYYGYKPYPKISIIDPIINAEEKLTWRKRYFEVMSSGKLQTFEYNFTLPSEEIYVSTTIFPIFHEGKVISIAAFSKDITKQRLYENTLKQLNVKFLGVLESSQDMVFAVDKELRFIFFNKKYKRAFEAVYGQVLEQGLSAYEGVTIPQQLAEFKAYTSRALKGENFSVERDFEGRTYEAVFNPIRYEEGDIVGVSVFMRDISYRVEAEAAIQHSQQLLASISRNIKEAIYRSTPEGDLIYANQAFLDIFDFESIEEAKNRKASLFYGKSEDRQKLINKLNQQGYYNNEELQLRRKDGSIFWGLVTSSRLVEDDGKVFYDGAIRDISETKRLAQTLKAQNEALSKANRELDRFVYSASHDLRAPLTSILGLIDLIKTDEDETQKAKYLDLILMSVKRLDDFIQQIIQYSRNTRLKVNIEEVDFSQLIEETISQLEYGEHRDKINIIRNIALTKPIYSDTFRLQIILNNLVSNAIRYHNIYQEKPIIKINLCNKDKGVLLEVEDNGQGIAEEHQERIFDMFYKANASRKGSGLGLYIVKESVEMIGGNIQLHSRLGEGSRFEIYLPDLKSQLYDVT